MKRILTITGTAMSALHGVAHAKTDTTHTDLSSLALKDLSYVVNVAAPANAADSINMFANHSSHSSHGSHSSHSSGSGSTYRAPVYAAPPPAVKAAPPSVNTLYSDPKPTADQLTMLIMRVQAALYSKGYDPGAIDGTLGAETKQALRKFQTANGLPGNAKMTTATLNALGVSLSP